MRDVYRKFQNLIGNPQFEWQGGQSCCIFIEMAQQAQLIITPEVYGIPSVIGDMHIRPMSWAQFPTSPPESTWFMAMIYWAVEYDIQTEPRFPNGGKVIPRARVLPKSWVNSKTCYKLLVHEYGHYLLACICALTFARRVNYEQRKPPDKAFKEWCQQVLNNTLREYCREEKQYDEQTYHFLREQEQQEWETKIKKHLHELHAYFEGKHKLNKVETSRQYPVKQTGNERPNLASVSRAKPTRAAIPIKNYSVAKRGLLPKPETVFKIRNILLPRAASLRPQLAPVRR